MSEWNRGAQFESVAVATPAWPSTKSPPKRKSRFGVFLAISTTAVLSALLGGLTGSYLYGAGYLQLNQPVPVVVNQIEKVSWVTGAAAQASPAVVTLSVSGLGGAGSGSGVILTSDGYILTNAHVVTMGGDTNSATISVRTWDGNVFEAELIGTDSTNDLAVLKIVASGLSAITFADSDKVNVGASVVAIGAPLGLSSTVTGGIVSALDRTIQVASSEVQEGNGLEFWNGTSGVPPISLQVIQTDAAINPGNSGGALVNEVGELIGINVAIATAGNGAAGSIGVGFAIPANTAARVAEEIITAGFASHGLLGALVSDTMESAAGFSTGATIVEVSEGGAADLAGLRAGDIVIQLDGKRVETASDLTALVRSRPAGAEVELRLVRNGSEVRLRVTLGNAADLG